MGKDIKKRIIIGICVIALAVIAGIVLDRNGFTGPESEMWQRFIFIGAALGTGLAGFLFILMSWQGLLFGYAFVLLIALPRTLPDPWNRYLAILYIGGLLAFTAWSNSKHKRKPSRVEPDEEFEDNDPEDEALDQLLKHKPVIVQQTTNGRFFQLIPCGSELRAYRVGGELRNVDVALLQDPKSPTRPLSDKDLTIPIASIQKVRCRDLYGNRGGYDCLAVVKTEKRTYRFAPTFYMERDVFLRFWPSIVPDAVEKKEEHHEGGSTVSAERLMLFGKVRMALYVYLAVVNLCWLFLAVPYKLFSLLSLLSLPAIFVLYVLFPDVYTMLEADKRISKHSLSVAAILGGIVPCLRTLLDFNFLNWTKLLIIAAVLIIVVVSLMMCLSKEWHARKAVLFYLIFAMLAYSIGFVGQVNCAFDPSEPVVTHSQILDKHISTGNKGPDTYYITVQVDGRELDLKIGQESYDDLSVGDTVTVSTFAGLLGIPYAYAE